MRVVPFADLYPRFIFSEVTSAFIYDSHVEVGHVGSLFLFAPGADGTLAVRAHGRMLPHRVGHGDKYRKPWTNDTVKHLTERVAEVGLRRQRPARELTESFRVSAAAALVAFRQAIREFLHVFFLYLCGYHLNLNG